MKNDRPKENEKGKYKRFSQFPSRNYTQRKSYLLFTRLYVVLAYIPLLGLAGCLLGRRTLTDCSSDAIYFM